MATVKTRQAQEADMCSAIQRMPQINARPPPPRHDVPEQEVITRCLEGIATKCRKRRR
jgi:hypothetical protein